MGEPWMAFNKQFIGEVDLNLTASAPAANARSANVAAVRGHPDGRWQSLR